MTRRRAYQKHDDPSLRRMRPKNRTVAKARAKKRRALEAEKKRVYAIVDERDHYRSRFSGLATNLEHHHIKSRSQGGKHTTDNVVLVTREENARIHAKRLRVSGDANRLLEFVEYDELGRITSIGTSEPVSQ